MTFGEIPKDEWPPQHISHLTGKAFNTFNLYSSNNYDKLQDLILNALMSKERYQQEFWNFYRKTATCEVVVRQLETMAE